MKSRRARQSVLLAASALSLASQADAAIKTWAAAVSGNWTTAAAWNLTGAPANGDTVLINVNSASNYLVNYDNPSTTQVYPQMTINSSGGGAAQLRTAGGTVYNITTGQVGTTGQGFWQIGGATANITSMSLGSAAGGTGTVTLSTGTLNVDSDLTVGGVSAGIFTQSGGLTTIDSELLMGAAAAGVGTVNLSGGTLNTATASIVGNFGNAQFNQSGGVHNTPQMPISVGSGAGTYLLQGGTLNAASLVIGDEGVFNQTGGVNDSGTTALNTGGTYLHTTGNNSIGTFIHNGGHVATNYFNNAFGRYVYNSGTFTGRLVNVGTAVFNTDFTAGDGMDSRRDLTIPVGRTLTLNGTGLRVLEDTLTLAGVINSTNTTVGGLLASSVPVMTQSGGTHTIGSQLRLGEGATAGTYNLNGGTLIAAGTTGLNGAVIGIDHPGQLNIGAGRASMTVIRVGDGAAGTINHTGTGDLSVASLTVGATTVGRYVHNNAGASVTASNLSIAAGPGAAGSQYTLTTGTLLTGSLVNNGTFLQTGGRSTLNAVSGTGSMDVIGTASMTVDRIRQARLNIADNARIFTVADGGNNGVSRVNQLFFEEIEFNVEGEWDLNNNDLVVDWTGANPADQIELYLASGHNFGNWQGDGLQSSAAAASVGTGDVKALGWVEATDVFSVFPATFVGQSVDSTSTLVRFTLAGDNNLDGTVNIDDFGLLASHFNEPGDWFLGDYNYDGTVDIDDFARLGPNFNEVLPGASARGMAVPEPGILSPVLLLAAVRQRRARCG